MKLENIDKARFKKHLNRFQAALVVGLMVLSLLLSELYIALWGGEESNTMLNVAAVITALLLLAGVMNLLKEQPWMYEIRYVKQLKGELNRIYRASKKLEEALAADKPEAIIVKYFQLHGSKHLYQLEDNTLTMEEQNRQIAELDERIAALGMTVAVEDYSPQLLDRL